MKRYHPFRFELLQQLQAKRQDRKSAELQARMLGLIKEQRFDLVSLAGDREMRAMQLADEGFDGDAAASWRQKIMEDVETCVSAFGERGKNIYDMTLVLRMLKRVEVDDVKVEDTAMPYPAIYMHYGQEAGLEASGGVWIDGAYVMDDEEEDGLLKVTFVTPSGLGARGQDTAWTDLQAGDLGRDRSACTGAAGLQVARGDGPDGRSRADGGWRSAEGCAPPCCERHSLPVHALG